MQKWEVETSSLPAQASGTNDGCDHSTNQVQDVFHWMEKSQQLEPNDAGTVAAGIGIYNGHPLPHCYFVVCFCPSSFIVHNKHGNSTTNGSIQLDLVGFCLLAATLANCFEVTMKIDSFVAFLGLLWQTCMGAKIKSVSHCSFLSFFSQQAWQVL